MNIVLLIPTSGVENGQPKEWFAQRLDAAIEYYHKQVHKNSIRFIVTGRWNSVDAQFLETEAEVARRYIATKLPEATIIKEDIAVETGGNIAFSKPLVAACDPDSVVVFCSRVHKMRLEYLVDKIFNPGWNVMFVTVDDSLSENPRAQAKEPKALAMFQALLDGIAQGDDSAARDILMYKTPFYFRGIMGEKEFFDSVWPGGYDDLKEKRLSIDNK